jgi:hypothetical protein
VQESVRAYAPIISPGDRVANVSSEPRWKPPVVCEVHNLIRVPFPRARSQNTECSRRDATAFAAAYTAARS